jgi:segregation and condensation protein B
MEKLEDAGLLDKEKLLADVSGALNMLGDEALAEEHDQP